MRYVSLLLAVALSASVVASFAVAQPGADIDPQRKPVAAERLSMPLFPSGWAEVFHEYGPIEIVEYVPEGQTAANWRDKITLQVFHELNDLPLDAIQRRMQGQNRNRCTGVIEGQLQSGLNNGFPSAFWTLGCRYLKDMGSANLGETQYSKAIQGSTALYVISRMWRTPAFGDDGPAIDAQDIGDGVAFLTTSIVCVPGSAEHPCGG